MLIEINIFPGNLSYQAVGVMCGQAGNSSNSGSEALSQCFPDKELYSTLSLFTQVYKWVSATYRCGVTLRWTSILSRVEKQYSYM